MATFSHVSSQVSPIQITHSNQQEPKQLTPFLKFGPFDRTQSVVTVQPTTASEADLVRNYNEMSEALRKSLAQKLKSAGYNVPVTGKYSAKVRQAFIESMGELSNEIATLQKNDPKRLETTKYTSLPSFNSSSQNVKACLIASLSNAIYIFCTCEVTSFFFNLSWMFLPSRGITLRLIAIISNGPSHKMIGTFQFIKNSNGTMFLDTFGFLYFDLENSSNPLEVK